jgi:hypothetical protein
MDDARHQATSGTKAAALLIGWISVAQLRPRGPFNLPETAYNAFVHDAQIEPVTWKVALGVIILAAFFGAVGWLLYRDQRQTLA